MSVPTIHIHSCSDKRTTEYVKFMWSVMREFANHSEALKLSVQCDCHATAERLSTLPNVRSYFGQSDVLGGGRNVGGSIQHGLLLERALTLVDDGDIHIIADSDTSILAKGWDDYIRLQLLDVGVGVVGPTFEEIGGFSSGYDKVQMFKKIPYTAWFAMSPMHNWHDLKVMSDKQRTILIENEDMANVYNLPVGHSLLLDVGWQIPQYLHDHKISYVGWPQLKGSKTATVIKGLNDYHEEYHVDNDVPFLVHQRGSRNHPFRLADSAIFYEAVDRWLEQERKRDARWTWKPNESNSHVLQRMIEISNSHVK